MDLEEIIYKRRTIRRFKQDPIPLDDLRKLVDYARVAPFGNNIQFLDYIIIMEKEIREKIFTCTAWAGSLPPELRIPEENRRPMAYIVALANKDIREEVGGAAEVGGAVQNILLGATNLGLGSCWMGAINRDKIREILAIPDSYLITFIVSLGFPDEESVMEPFEGSMKYWRTNNGVMHIPKRSLDDVIHKVL